MLHEIIANRSQTMVSVLNQSFTCDGNSHVPSWKDITKACIICVVTLGIVVGNVFSALVFNNERGKKMFLKKVRLTMNSLICTDLSMGILVCPFCVYSALYRCWPFSETFCKFEALFLSALFHESTMSLVIIAVDRYCSVHFYFAYNSFMTSRKYVIVIFITWLSTFCVYGTVIFHSEQFYFDEIGINCEPYYENRNITITVLCLFYICPALLFFFSYGSIFYTANRKKDRLRLFAGNQNTNSTRQVQTAVTQVLKTSKYLAAISIGFFVAITPWSVSTMVIALTSIELNEDLDFAVTWLAISNSFWNVIIYCLMNRKFSFVAMIGDTNHGFLVFLEPVLQLHPFRASGCSFHLDHLLKMMAAKLIWCRRFFSASTVINHRNTFHRSTLSYVSNSDQNIVMGMTVTQSAYSLETNKMAVPKEDTAATSNADCCDCVNVQRIRVGIEAERKIKRKVSLIKFEDKY